MKTIFYVCSFIGLLFVTSISAQERSFSFQENYEMGGESFLKITNNDGFIDVYPSNSNTIQVFYIVKYKGRLVSIDRNELEEYLEVDVRHNGRSLEIVIRRHKTDGWINWNNRHHVSFEVLVPKTTSCDLKSSDGDIYVKGLEADQYCKTSDGDIDVSFVKGDVRGFTSDGDVFASDVIGYSEFKTSDGDIKVKNMIGDARYISSDGSIDIYNIKGVVFAHTSDGNVYFEEVKGGLEAETSDGHIKGDMTELYEHLELSTSDGDIEVVIPEGLGLDLRLRGEHILTDLRNFHGSSKKRSVQGSINGGGILVDLRTSDGRISLRYRD